MASWNEIIIYIKNQLSTNQFFSAAAFASVLTAVLMSLKGVPKSIWDRIVRFTTYKATVYQTDELYYYLTEWFNDNHKGKVRNVEYSSAHSMGDEFHTVVTVGDNLEGNGSLIEVPVDDYFYKWMDRRLIKISYGKEKLENASSLKSAYLKSYTIKGVFASRAIRNLIERVNEEYRDKNKIPHVYQSDGHYFSRISKVGGKKLSEVILKEEVKDRIISDLSEWKNSRKEYERRGIPYKRGHCYYGPPGTGKTTIVKSIAREHGFNVYSINLKKTEDDSLISLLRNIEPGSILLFEDIDSTFDGRKRIGSKGVTFSGFLNALDGIVELTGVLVIITTNHAEKMDPALMRAGRMDLKVEISYSSKKEISEYVTSFYNRNIQIKGEGVLPMVEVQNVCLENKNDYKKSIKILEDLLSKSVYS